MYKFTVFLSALVIVSLLMGCVGKPAEINAVTPTITPQKVEPTLTPEIASTPTTEVVSENAPANCPVTVPQNPPFTPPAPYDKLGFKGYFWYGSNSLWTVVPENGVWGGLPYNPPSGLTQKIVWWRDVYSWDGEPQPNLIVTGKRLDANAPPLNVSSANGVYASDIGSAMMVGADLPSAGCWKIVGKYKDAELSFVVWIAP